jgi:hypothetical protein
MKPSYTSINNFLKSCVWNPKLPGPLNIISDIGNANYYETRAIEYIKEINEVNFNDNITKAIQLLALSHETRKNIGNESKDYSKDKET